MGANEVKMREVIGTESDYGISQVAKEQVKLEYMMEKLKKTFVEKTIKWE